MALFMGLSRMDGQKDRLRITTLTDTEGHFFCGCQRYVGTTSWPEPVFEDNRIRFAPCREKEMSRRDRCWCCLAGRSLWSNLGFACGEVKLDG